MLLEAPTGFGKSAVAIALALSLGSSYICTSTKDLQTQYSKDFPYIKAAKGKNNFPCLLKQDFLKQLGSMQGTSRDDKTWGCRVRRRGRGVGGVGCTNLRQPGTLRRTTWT